MNLSSKILSSASAIALVLLASAGESLGRSQKVEIEKEFGRSSPQLIAFDPVEIEGTLDDKSEVSALDSYYNYHVFEGKAGDQIAIDLTSKDFDAYLLLWTAEEEFVALNDDGGQGSNARIVTTLPTSGTYRIQVLTPAHSTSTTGNYTLTIQTINAPDSLGGIGKLDENSEVFEDKTYYNRHRIEGRGGESIAIELNSEEFDTYLILRDPEGNILAENNDRIEYGESVDNAGIVLTLPTTGIYEVIAKADAVEAGGTYQLIWREANLGDIATLRVDRRDQEEAAIAFYENALALHRQIGDRHWEAKSLSQLASALEYVEPSRAIEHYRQAIALYRDIGKPSAAELALRSLGRIYKNGEDYPNAIETFQGSIALGREIGNPIAERQSLRDIADIYETLEDYPNAIDYYEQTLVFAREFEDRVGIANLLEQLGDIYAKLENAPKALGYYEQVLAMNREDGDRVKEARTFMTVARAYEAWNNEPEAIEYYRKALAIMEEEGEEGSVQYIGELLQVLERSPLERQDLAQMNEEADRLFASGIEQFNRRQFSEALRSWETAAGIYQNIEDRFQENLALVGLGNVYSALGNGYYVVEDYEQSGDRYQKSLETFKSLDERTNESTFVMLSAGGEVTALIGLGNVARARGEYDRAIELYQRSLNSDSGITLVPLTAQSVRNLGNAYLAAGEYVKAIESYTELRKINRGIDNPTGEGIAAIGLGDTYLALGEYDRAIEFYRQSLPILQEIGDTDVTADSGIFRDTQLGITYSRSANINQDRAGEGKVLIGLGNAYLASGDYTRGINFYEGALAIMRENGNRLGEGSSFIGLGNAYLASGDYAKAIEFYQQSLTILRDVRDRQEEGETLVDLDFAYEVSLTLDRDRAGEGASLVGLGNAYLAREEYPRAVEFYQQSLAIMKAIGNRPGEKDSLSQLARAKYKQGNLEGAIADIRAAIAISESIRARVKSPELRQSFFATVSEDYRLYIDILMELHRQNPDRGYDKQALNVSERNRARTLTEILAEANLDIRQNVDPQLLKEEQRLIRELSQSEQSRLELTSRSYNNRELEGIKSNRDRLLQELADIETRIRRTSPDYADLKYPQPLTLEEIQSQVLDRDTLLLEYALGSDRSYLFVVGKNSFSSHELPPRQEIEAAVEKYAIALQAEDRNPLAEGKDLAQMLLNPIAEMLKGQRLAIVPDGKLHRLPFGALPWVVGASGASGAGEEQGIAPLLAHHEIVHLSSASSLAIQRQQLENRSPAAKKLAVFADPVFSQR
ncbi:MAG: tetratricopeptide repeat protein, partial [Cyanobacteria bacterium SBLK]|nr:tetratricopeptide repeat protein [Cyanobacteria bacterium SBLK]